MKKFLKPFLLLTFLVVSTHLSGSPDSTGIENQSDFQIYLKQPAKEIKLLMYEKDFLPIQGKLSEDRRSVIMKNYQNGTRVRVKVLYEDGTEDEFVKSPCYIDPVILNP